MTSRQYYIPNLKLLSQVVLQKKAFEYFPKPFVVQTQDPCGGAFWTFICTNFGKEYRQNYMENTSIWVILKKKTVRYFLYLNALNQRYPRAVPFWTLRPSFEQGSWTIRQCFIPNFKFQVVLRKKSFEYFFMYSFCRTNDII